MIDGDLRDPEIFPLESMGQFSLITGTPPYFRDGEGVESDVTQRGPCRFEHRGGVEDYARAAARWLSDDGVCVLCAGALERERAIEGITASGLSLESQIAVIPRARKSPLIDVYVLRREPVATPSQHTLVVRDVDEQWTPEFIRVRETMGMPVLPRRSR